MAVYNLSSLNLNKCKVLKGKNVYLFPDLSKDGKAFELWSSKATEIQKCLQGTYFHVSDLLERLAPHQDKEKGKDIADCLIEQDWRLYKKQDIKEMPEPKPETRIKEQPENWDDDITELEEYFSRIELPAQPIKLNKSSTITDSAKFLESHIITVKANNGNPTFLPYLNRIKEFRLHTK